MDPFLLYVLHVCLYNIVLCVSSSLVVTYCEMADLLAHLCVMLYCLFVTFPYGVLGQVWYMIVLIHYLCLLLDFYMDKRLMLLYTLKQLHIKRYFVQNRTISSN